MRFDLCNNFAVDSIVKKEEVDKVFECNLLTSAEDGAIVQDNSVCPTITASNRIFRAFDKIQGGSE